MKKLNVLDFSVKRNCKTLQTQQVQEVFDMCKENGGEVYFPTGTYNISSLRLFSNMKIILEENTKLIASSKIEDYIDFELGTTLGYASNDYYVKKWNIPKHYTMGVFLGSKVSNVSIIGKPGSSINGQDCYDKNGEEGFRGPMGIVFTECDNITLSGYEYINSANWSHQLDSTSDIKIESVKITAGHDGFNLHHCTNITITNCNLETGDDCIAGYDIHNLLVKNCYLNTSCNSLRVGGAQIIVEDCELIGPGKYEHLSKNTFYTHSAFKYYAMKEEPCRYKGNVIFKNCKISEMNKLLVYNNGSKDNLQDGLPLEEVIFKGCQISNIKESTSLRANGENLKIIFDNCNLPNVNTCAKELLEIDNYIEVTLNDCNIKHNKNK